MEQKDQAKSEIWYLALKRLHIAQGPGVKPSTLRIAPGQRFTLDGDEPLDVESLLRTRAIKLYEESDAEWAQAQLGEQVATPRRRAQRGKN